MRFLWNLYDHFLWLVAKKKAYNSDFIKLARPSEIVNVNVGQVITGVNRYDGSFTFGEFENKVISMKRKPSPVYRR